MLRRSLLALLLCCSLAGCGDDEPKPRFEPRTETTSSTPPPTTQTSEPGPVEPEMPALAKKHTTAGAEAFVEFYWEVAEFAQLTGRTAGLKVLADSRCDTCSETAAIAERLHADNSKVTGGLLQARPASSSEVTVDGEPAAKVVMTLVNTRQRVDHPGDKQDEIFAADKVDLTFYAVQTPRGWRAFGWEYR